MERIISRRNLGLGEYERIDKEREREGDNQSQTDRHQPDVSQLNT